MSGQEDYWEVAAQIAARTLPESTWGPNVNVASTAGEKGAATTGDEERRREVDKRRTGSGTT